MAAQRALPAQVGLVGPQLRGKGCGRRWDGRLAPAPRVFKAQRGRRGPFCGGGVGYGVLLRCWSLLSGELQPQVSKGVWEQGGVGSMRRAGC